MPTVIDELIVTLGLDPENFTKGQKTALTSFKKTQDEAARAAKEMENSGKQAANFFTPVIKQVAKLATAYLGLNAIKDAAVGFITADAAVGRLSKNVGENAQTLSAWEGVAKRFGATSEDVDGAFRAMAHDAQQMALTGGSPYIQFLARAGVDTAKFYDKTTTAEDKLRMLSAAFSKLSPQQAQFYGQSMGMSESFVTMLSSGSTALDALIARQRTLNAATQESANSANELNKAWSDLTDTIGGKTRRAVEAATPYITKELQGLKLLLDGQYEAGSRMDEWVNGKKSAPVGTRERRGVIGGRGGDAKSKLIGMGWSDAQAQGIVNNLNRESRLNPGAVGDGGNAYGIAQWHPDRQAIFQMLFGKPMKGSSLDEQLQFLNSELRMGQEKKAGRALMGANTADEATRVVYEQYERPAMPYDKYIAGAMGKHSGGGGNVTSTDVSIGQIIVNTKATDADGIAKSIGPSIRNLSLASQAQSGLQ